MGCWPRPWGGGKIGTAMGYLGGATIGGQAWEKGGGAGVEISSAERSPDLTWSQTRWKGDASPKAEQGTHMQHRFATS